jgi:hypothetical protein
MLEKGILASLLPVTRINKRGSREILGGDQPTLLYSACGT